MRSHNYRWLSLIILAACGSSDDGSSHGSDLTNLPAGGEIRLELLRQADGSTVVRLTSYLIEQHTGPRTPRPTPDGCVYAKRDGLWPQHIADGRTYFDMGNAITVNSDAGVLPLERLRDTPDFLGREHDIVYQMLSSAPEDAALVPADTMFTVKWPGSDNLEAGEREIFIPATYTTTPPTPGALTIPAAEDFELKYEMVPQSEDEELFGFLAIANAEGVQGICTQTDYESGTMVVPAAFLADMPEQGVFVQGTITHDQINMNGRHVDFLGMNCGTSSYSIE